MPNAIPTGELTVQHALQGGSIASSIREHGRIPIMAWIIKEIDTVNQLTGNGLGEQAVTMCAELIIDRFKFRTPNALRIALRDGLNSGKIYGKLTYPIIAEWLTEHEERMEQHGYQQHMASK